MGSKNKKETPQMEETNTKAATSSQNRLSSKNFKSGAYSTMLITLMIVIVLIVNLAIGRLDLKLDVSNNHIFTLTDTTKEIVKGLEDDITIYYIAQEGLEADTIKRVVDKYDSLSSKITVEVKDLVLYPNFASQYYDGEILSDSVVVVNETTGAYKYIDYENMLTYRNTSLEIKTSGIDVEGQITSAIQRVTASDLPKMYYVGGHGETTLSDSFKNAVNKQNVDLVNLNMLVDTEIPEDCDVLLFNGPTYDLSEDETELVKQYMEQGGNVIILLANSQEEMPNFHELLNYYGVNAEPGIIVETSGYCLGTYQTYLLPKNGFHESISKAFSDGLSMIVPLSQGLTELDSKRSSLDVQSLLYTSDKAYLKVNTKAETTAKEAGDVDGPFRLAFMIEEKTGTETGKMLVVASHYFIDESMLSSGQYGNAAFMTEIISYMTGAGLSIPTRSLEQQYVVVSGTQITVWGIVVVGVIPLILLGTGFVIWMKRRRR